MNNVMQPYFHVTLPGGITSLACTYFSLSFAMTKTLFYTRLGEAIYPFGGAEGRGRYEEIVELRLTNKTLQSSIIIRHSLCVSAVPKSTNDY